MPRDDGVVRGENWTQLSGIRSYDFDKEKIAEVFIGHYVIRVVKDYNKGVMYTMVAGQCFTTPWPYPIVNCIPDNATMIGNFEVGGPDGLMVEQYHLNDFLPGLKGYIQFSRAGCLPVSQAQFTDTHVTKVGVANITVGIKDPNVFDVPSPPCPMDVDSVVNQLLIKPADF
ncbi:Hypp7283 [Branchiostoma lanceolatum]|uniref:Hypp7283 protein n=1 Tax=Branchiostoma lanceolatum TaxID=7740 RepID=A0A8K0ECR6_BRALA|nr:Hypp7283 [Branchiostoma lanceolatum]